MNIDKIELIYNTMLDISAPTQKEQVRRLQKYFKVSKFKEGIGLIINEQKNPKLLIVADLYITALAKSKIAEGVGIFRDKEVFMRAIKPALTNAILALNGKNLSKDTMIIFLDENIHPLKEKDKAAIYSNFLSKYNNPISLYINYYGPVPQFKRDLYLSFNKVPFELLKTIQPYISTVEDNNTKSFFDIYFNIGLSSRPTALKATIKFKNVEKIDTVLAKLVSIQQDKFTVFEKDELLTLKNTKYLKQEIDKDLFFDEVEDFLSSYSKNMQAVKKIEDFLIEKYINKSFFTKEELNNLVNNVDEVINIMCQEKITKCDNDRYSFLGY